MRGNGWQPLEEQRFRGSNRSIRVERRQVFQGCHSITMRLGINISLVEINGRRVPPLSYGKWESRPASVINTMTGVRSRFGETASGCRGRAWAIRVETASRVTEEAARWTPSLHWPTTL